MYYKLTPNIIECKNNNSSINIEYTLTNDNSSNNIVTPIYTKSILEIYPLNYPLLKTYIFIATNGDEGYGFGVSTVNYQFPILSGITVTIDFGITQPPTEINVSASIATSVVNNSLHSTSNLVENEEYGVNIKSGYYGGELTEANVVVPIDGRIDTVIPELNSLLKQIFNKKHNRHLNDKYPPPML
mmetsp:Transcript_60344/g.73934  ORF Transcript_60344/g.73934 Transcript_60344/m.73934 type:complete len:186 (+) Transcript_60344:138-695(+)